MKYINAEMIKSRMNMAGFSKEYISHLIGNLSPTDVVEVKRGEWIKSNPLTDTFECSLCGYNILSEELITPFCPWCGADMRDTDNLKGETK